MKISDKIRYGGFYSNKERIIDVYHLISRGKDREDSIKLISKRLTWLRSLYDNTKSGGFTPGVYK